MKSAFCIQQLFSFCQGFLSFLRYESHASSATLDNTIFQSEIV